MGKRIAVIGAGGMARVRARALLATGQAELCGIASRHRETACACGADLGCNACFDDYRRLLDTRPDAVLVEVPHAAQDEIVPWALEHDLHVLIGGTAAGSVAAGQRIAELARRRQRVVEAGYEQRYSPLWETARALLRDGALGQLVALRSIALWNGDPATWYYGQQASGGMPLTHMTYCFLNPLRWLAGDPVSVSAFANRKKHTAPGLITEETCVANLLFPGDVLCSMTAGFVSAPGLPGWSITIIGTAGALDLVPAENGIGTLTVYGQGQPQVRTFADARDPFLVQAETFLAALDGRNDCRNPPAETLGDLRVVEAIVTSVREGRTVTIPQA